jgi:hypothetical protein
MPETIKQKRQEELVNALLKNANSDLHDHIGTFLDCDSTIERKLQTKYDWMFPIKPSWCTDAMLRKRSCHYTVFQQIVSDKYDVLMPLREKVFYESIHTARLSHSTKFDLEYKVCDEDDAWFTYLQFNWGTLKSWSAFDIGQYSLPAYEEYTEDVYAVGIDHDEDLENVEYLKVGAPIRVSCFPVPIYKVTIPHPIETVHRLRDYLKFGNSGMVNIRKGDTSYCIFDLRAFLFSTGTFRLRAQPILDDDGGILQPETTLPPVQTPFFENIWLVVHTIHKLSTRLRKMHKTMTDEGTLDPAQNNWYADLRLFDPNSRLIAVVSTKNYGGENKYRTEWVFRHLLHFNRMLLLQEAIPSIPLEKVQVIFHPA